MQRVKKWRCRRHCCTSTFLTLGKKHNAFLHFGRRSVESMSRAVPSQRLRQETLRNWQIKAISHVTYKQTMLKMLHEGFSKVRHTKAAHCSAIETDGSEALYRLSLPLFDKEPFLHQKTRKTYVLRAECQKSGGAGGTASCRGYRGRAPNPCAAALFPQTSVALFAGNGGQLGVFRQTARKTYVLRVLL